MHRVRGGGAVPAVTGCGDAGRGGDRAGIGNARAAAGTGNVCFNCLNNAGTGGVAFGSGGATPSTVGTIDASGNETLYGYQRFFASGSEAWRFNCASGGSCAIDSWTSGSPVHHLRLYNGAGTDIESEGSTAVTVNNTTGSGTGGLIVYGGGAAQWFAVTNSTAIKFPGLATATSGYGDVRLDTSGWMTNAGAYTSSGTASGSTTTASHTFATAYTSTPACTATLTSNVGNFYISSQSTTAITITYATSGTGSFNIICRGPGGIY